MAEWQPISTAPKDGSEITARYQDGAEDLVFWQEEGRHCVLGPRAGSYPAGWTSIDAGNLPVEGLTEWKTPEPPKEQESS